MRGPPHAFQQTVNVAGIELALTPLNVASPAPGTGKLALPGAAGSELSAFLSLVNCFLEKPPLIPGDQIDLQPSTVSDKAGMKKDTKSHKKDDSAFLLPAPPAVQDVGAFVVTAPTAFEFHMPVPDPPPLEAVVEQSIGEGKPEEHPSPATRPLLPSLPAITSATGNVAFALRLTPSAPDAKPAPRVAVPAQPQARNSGFGPGPKPLESSPDPISHLKPIDVLLKPLGLAGDSPAPSLSDPFQESTSSPVQFLTQKGEHIDSTPIVETTSKAQVETTKTDVEISPQMSSTLIPLLEASLAPSGPSRPQPSIEAVEAPAPEPSPHATTNPIPSGPEPESREDAAVRPAVTPVVQPDGPIKRSSVPQASLRSVFGPAKPVRMPETEPKESSPEAVVKRELPPAQIAGRHIDSNPTAIGGPTRPVEGTRAELGGARPSAGESPESKVVNEPEIKVGIAPPPTRQISLKLSTDDSTRVNVDVTERAGKVQVAVRTADHQLAQSLQTDLGDLVSRLENKGFKTEAWIPATVHTGAAPPQPANSNTDFGQPQHSGSGPGSDQHRQQQNGSNQRQPARWNAQMEETMSANEIRSEQ